MSTRPRRTPGRAARESNRQWDYAEFGAEPGRRVIICPPACGRARRRNTPDPEDGSSVQRDILGFEVFLDAFTAALAPEPGFLDATEGCRHVGDDATVYPDHAGFDGS